MLNFASLASSKDVDAMEMNLRQLGVLGFLAQTATMVSVREISEALTISKPAATRNIQKLTSLGLAVSNRSKTDSRLVEIKITTDGKNFLKAMDKELNKPSPAEKAATKKAA